jgi:hypothetical protein
MRWLPLLLVAACSSACSSSGTSTRGQHGRDSFAYLATPGCEDGCNLQQFAVAADDAQQEMQVSGAAFAGVSSSADSIASFTLSGGQVSMTTAMSGDADLILSDGAGTEVDRVTVHVVDVAELEFTKGWSGSGPLVLESVPITFGPVTKLDAGNRTLLGAQAVHFQASGTVSLMGAPSPAPNAPPTILESMIFQAAAGTGDLTGQNGSQSFDIAVTAVTLNDLSMLTATVGESVLGSGGATIDTPVAVNAATPAGNVYGPTCSWAVSDPSVEVVVTGNADELQGPATSGATFKLTKDGTFTATCSIGRLTAVVPLKRDN